MLAVLFLPLPQAGESAPRAATGAAARYSLGYGMMSEPGRFNIVADAGFNWVKLFISWKSVQPSRDGPLDWSSVDWMITYARELGLMVLVRVDDTPSWASGTDAHNAPPLNDADFANFMFELAKHYRGLIAAYEIWNEPNTDVEWGMRRPDPVKFASMLKALYPRVKDADPDAIVVSGGLSNTGDGDGNRALGDLQYLVDMYKQGGAKGSFDAIGVHPYGGPYPPEQDPWDPNRSFGLYFRRIDNYRQMMMTPDHGIFDDIPIWPTEFGWLEDFGMNCTFADSYRQAQKVTAEQRADYFVRAFLYARQNWDGRDGRALVGPMFIYNLDKNVGKSPSCDEDHERYFGLLHTDTRPTLAFTALKQMKKTDQRPRLLVSPTSVGWYVQRGGTLIPLVVVLTNPENASLPWLATTSAGWLRLTPSSGTLPPGGSTSIAISAQNPPLAALAGQATTVVSAQAYIIPQRAYYQSTTVTVNAVAADRVYQGYMPSVAQQFPAGW